MKNLLTLGLLTLSVCLFAQSQKYKGYPQKGEDLDVLPGFIHPPKGYGNVPFYWWNGDSLNRDRLQEQLDILSSAAVDGFAVSYAHLNPEVEIDEVLGKYGLFGNTEPGAPRVFSEEWWKVWKWFTEACAAKNIGLGLDDYTVGWTGNGYYPDELLQIPGFKEYQGELNFEKISVEPGSVFTCDLPENLLSVVAWPDGIDLTSYVKEGKDWTVPLGKSYDVYVITTKNGYLIHPDHGRELVRVYFNRFEERLGDIGGDGMNYFFQDELLYPLTWGTWSEDFAAQFIKRKGYDLIPYLPGLKENIGEITPKIRLDYADVLVDLAEERYMKPVYDWHAERGLIYGSDNLGRGLEPLAYMDYFRMNSWYTAPGNDAPSKGSSFIQTKVSSSITHMYERPRTWLEAFHSMGWGSSGEWLTRQIDHHLIAGGNLVCMHGLYYSTHGGWWEWAPPCFHFRMPYWPHMKKWLEYTERMSYVLSQGTHVCDIAILYPTESMQAYPDATEKEAFHQAWKLSEAGLDYDFINYTSLQKASIKDGWLEMAGEKFRVMVLADIKAMHYMSLKKMLEFYRSGGIVLATGELPKASTLSGENDPEVDNIIKEIFGFTSSEANEKKIVGRNRNASGGIGCYVMDGDLVAAIRSLITPDFDPGEAGGKVLHRRIGQRDLYMVMDVPQGTECFFRATGKAELWDAETGEVRDLPVIEQTGDGTRIRLDKEFSNSALIVFSPGQPRILNDRNGDPYKMVQEVPVEGEWEVELLPTMDNKWGDFRLPAIDGFIGAEARTFKYSSDMVSREWVMPGYDDSAWPENIYGFGSMTELYCLSGSYSPREALQLVRDGQIEGTVVDISWQYGVWNEPGSQGYHGLKGKVDDRFFILDKGGHQIYKTYVYVPANGYYRIEQEGTEADQIWIDEKEVPARVQLSSGWHSLVILYTNTTPKKVVMSGAMVDQRDRGAVVVLPESSPTPGKVSAYDKIISTRWATADPLLYDPWGGKKSRWNYRFHSAPGLCEMEFTVAGDLSEVWINGSQLPENNIQLVNTSSAGINTYQVTLSQTENFPGLVAFSIDALPGYQGTSVICEPVSLKTEKGLLFAGDWSQTGALKYYSGGMYYRKQISVDSPQEGQKVFLDLGNVVATCEIKVNGTSAGILINPPYQKEITPFIKPGVNEIEVLVYSTLSNHYQTVPTPYRGEPVAGLLGPVKVIYKSME